MPGIARFWYEMCLLTTERGRPVAASTSSFPPSPGRPLPRSKPATGRSTPAPPGNGRSHWVGQGPFAAVIEPFLAACPGPFLAAQGLRIAASQRIEGITGTESYDRRLGGRREYLRSIARVADEIRVRPGYLSESALRRGYQYSRALRWIRFLHGKALYDQGIRSDTLARRLGFADPAGWTRFVKALNGAAPSDLPPLPLGVWVERAIEDVYMGC